MLPSPVDLLDFWRGELSLRRLWVLIQHLPRESPFIQAVNPGAKWGPGEHLFADYFDTWAAVKSGGKAAAITRPGQLEREATARELRMQRFERYSRDRNKELKGGVDDG